MDPADGDATGRADDAAVARLRAVARVMDRALRIPGTPIRLGADALVGLLPGVGDVVGGVVSSWFLLTAARLGAPPVVLARMALNVAIDALIGAVPLLGDLFDVGWKANSRNLALVEAHLADPLGARRRSAWTLGGIAVLLLVVVGVLIALTLRIAWAVLEWLSGVV